MVRLSLWDSVLGDGEAYRGGEMLVASGRGICMRCSSSG